MTTLVEDVTHIGQARYYFYQFPKIINMHNFTTNSNNTVEDPYTTQFETRHCENIDFCICHYKHQNLCYKHKQISLLTL